MSLNPMISMFSAIVNMIGVGIGIGTGIGGGLGGGVVCGTVFGAIPSGSDPIKHDFNGGGGYPVHAPCPQLTPSISTVTISASM
jgi:hypothetical protein